MIFNSLNFTLFLSIVFVFYWFVTNKSLKIQNILLLVSSYFFYACWDWRFLFLLIFSTVLDYYTGIKMSDSKNQNSKKFWFWLSISVNLGFLGVFKYYNFFAASFADAIANFGLQVNPWTLKVILPVGISFYTFHGLSYVIDIYKDRIKAEKNFIDYSVFVSFFPLLVAGPIERATHLLPQIQKKRAFNFENAVDGLKQILWGLFKKVVIADNCAKFSNIIFDNYTDYSGSTLALGAVFFAFQIYGDFSGYSDIALGSAQVMGFKLMQNFDRPYFSKTISEFWRRWHISLSTWFRDYLYIPLGGSRVPYYRQLFNLFIVFMVSGLWHGASWNFIIWGALHGLLLVLARLREKYLPSLQLNATNLVTKIIHIIIVFILVDFCWIFFRARTFADAKYIITHLLSNISLNSLKNLDFVRNNILLGESKQIFLVTIFSLILMEIVHYSQRNRSIRSYLSTQNRWLRWGLYCLLISWILLFGAFEKPAQFIYFQF